MGRHSFVDLEVWSSDRDGDIVVTVVAVSEQICWLCPVRR